LTTKTVLRPLGSAGSAGPAVPVIVRAGTFEVWRGGEVAARIMYGLVLVAPL
jgi:hypothetical protein